MSSLLSEEFLRAVPKTDLHVHLDGSLRIPTLIELARERGVELPADDEAGLRREVFRENYANLGEYLHGFKYTCAVLRDAEALERCAFELAEDSFNEGVRYLEVRFAPQLNMSEQLDLEQTLIAVTRGLQRAEVLFNSAEPVASGKEPPFKCGIIVCAMRFFTGGFSPYYADYVDLHRYRPLDEVIRLAAVDVVAGAVAVRDRLGLPIVGFDLAGQENGYPAGPHREAYEYAHRNFLKKTVHAGEAFGPESIFQAITRLYADRIGHGYHLFSPELITSTEIVDRDAYISKLAQYIADRRITLEVCLTSNLQTMPELKSLRDHAMRKMLNAKLSVTICTDNRLMSNTTMCRELRLAIESFDLDSHRLRQLIIYGFKRSFFHGTYNEKRAYVRSVIDHYDRVAAEFGIA